MYIHCMLDAGFCIYPLGQAYEQYCLHLLYSSNFCLLELSVTERVVLKSHTMTMDLLTYNFILYVFWSYIIKSIEIQNFYIFLENCACYIITLFLPNMPFGVRSSLSDDNIAVPDFTWLVIFLMYLFASFYFQLFYVIMFQVCLL